jgi:hypothetical protein
MKPSRTVRLPYQDTKSQGAADFYFAIHATFRFIYTRLGRDAWIKYLRDMAVTYFAPVNAMWQTGGLPSVAGYWYAFFEAEPGATVDIKESTDFVAIEVNHCPAISHLRTHAREIIPYYCQHCYFLNEARAAAAGLCMRLEGGNGKCRHTYSHSAPPQDMAAIREVTPC